MQVFKYQDFLLFLIFPVLGTSLCYEASDYPSG